MRAAVIVLGDLGRSPRMQYHARALGVNGVQVDLIGEAGTDLPSWFDLPGLTIHRLTPRRGISGVLGSAVALLAQGLRLPRPDVVLVQTPPALPTLPVAWLVARLRGARLIADWHNLGWSLLQQRGGRWAALAPVARWLEEAFARLADGHLAVSDALSAYLRERHHGIDVSTVRDRPADNASAERGHADAMRRRLLALGGLEADDHALIALSPSSWTSDERMEWLLRAADALEGRLAGLSPHRRLLLVASGRGPSRERFESQIRDRAADRVRVITTFVDSDDYPDLLAAADLGICLHQSSSGLDIPMKVFDLFGAGVPVCALDYGDPIREVVIEGVNGRLFRDSTQLTDILWAVMHDAPAGAPMLTHLREGVRSTVGLRWTDGWLREAAPVLGVGRRAR